MREGTNNILKNPDIVKDKPKYKDVSNPKYCILTSDKKEIMGSTTINNLIKKINDEKNINNIAFATPIRGGSSTSWYK